MARNPKRTAEIDAILVKALEQGASRRAACAAARICEKTFANWLARYSDFYNLIARAEALAEISYTAVIKRAAQPRIVTRTKVKEYVDKSNQIVKLTETVTEEVIDWRAAAYWLSTRRSQDWAKDNLSDVSDEALLAKVQPIAGAAVVAEAEAP